MADSKKVYDLVCRGDLQSLKLVPLNELTAANLDFQLLELSIASKHEEIFQHLLEAGLNDFKQNSFGNIFHVIISNGKNEIMSPILLKHQEKFKEILNEKDDQNGKTPIEFAMSSE